jgi:TonB family protein
VFGIQNNLMKQSFLTHFTTILILHALILVGSFELVDSEPVKKVLIQKFGNGVLKMKVSSGLIMTSAPRKPKTPQPTNPAKRAVSAPTQPTAQASVEGTGGSPNGKTFGNSHVSSSNVSVMDLYKAELRAKIDENKSYPTLSKRLGQTGTVVIAFTLLEDGNIVNVRIEKPSQYDRLNVSALDAVKKVERFKPLPKELGEEKMDVTVPVKFITI